MIVVRSPDDRFDPPPAPGARVHRRRGPPPRLPARASARSARPSASRRAPRCTRTSRRCRTRATSPATPPSPVPSRSTSRSIRASPSSAVPCATCRSSATSPPAPACSRPRTSRRRSPIPEDFTGDGELFMLRVRGDSMIEAGIFDGDYVVVRQQPDAEPGDIVDRRHPRRRGHGQDLPPASQQDRAAAREPHDGRDGLRPERRHHLRQGRLAPPPSVAREALLVRTRG